MSDNTGYLTMEITPYIEGLMKKHFEIEMLQGIKEVLPDGRIKYEIEINDPVKSDAMKEAMLKFISDSQNACEN